VKDHKRQSNSYKTDSPSRFPYTCLNSPGANFPILSKPEYLSTKKLSWLFWGLSYKALPYRSKLERLSLLASHCETLLQPCLQILDCDESDIPAYYAKVSITVVKSFVIQPPGWLFAKLITVIVCVGVVLYHDGYNIFLNDPFQVKALLSL